jgi:penicillin-binding protein 2
MESKFQDSEFGSELRRKIFFVLIAATLGGLGLRLAYMQFIRGSFYGARSEAQGIKRMVREPVRGAMYDRNGVLIVGNQPGFSVIITPREITKDAISKLAQILEIDTTYITERLAPVKDHFQPVKIWRDATPEIVGKIEEWHDRLPGVTYAYESKRMYMTGARLSHLLGYTKEITTKQLDRDTTHYYTPGDGIGVTGIEGSYEDSLRGVKGYEFVAVNAYGQRVSRVNEGRNDIDAQDGYALTLGLDANLQEYAEQLMKGKRGSVVAIDPANGDILAYLSVPDFDLNDFSGRTPASIYRAMLDDPAKPMFNRAGQTRYPPGSTFKICEAAGALDDGVVDKNWSIVCNGAFQFGDHVFHCDAVHGRVDAQRAISASCDVYFYQLILKMGLETWRKWALTFGFGQKTGIDIGDEGSGLLPTDEYFTRAYKTKNWPKGVLVSLGIGQGDMGVTPLQMAAYVGALGTGTWVQPHAVHSVFNRNTKQNEIVQAKRRDIVLKDSTWAVIRRGMFDVVNTPGGTAYASKIADVTMCGKTGTAQNAGRDHSWFIAYAPADHPKIAICVLGENAGWGASVAAPIARDLVEFYLTGRKHDLPTPTPSGPADSTKKTVAVR